MKIKNRSQRYDINRPSSRHGHTFSKCKNYLSIMMLICMLISIHEKVKQHRMSEKTVAYIKKSCISNCKFAGSCKKRWNPKKGEMKIFFGWVWSTMHKVVQNFQRNTKCQNVRVRIRGKKCSFVGKFGVPCFLVTCFEIRPLALLP